MFSCESTFSLQKVNRQVGANEGNIEVSVRVESKRQVLPVFGTLILLSQVKFIFILQLGAKGRTFGSPAANAFHSRQATSALLTEAVFTQELTDTRTHG